MSGTNPRLWQDVPCAPPAGEFVCQTDAVPDGGAFMATFGDMPKPFRLLVVRSGSSYFGYVNRCSHFGVPLAQKIGRLILDPGKELTCNVHYSRFDWRDGRCLGGECAGEGLLPVPLEVVEQRLVIGSTNDEH